MRACPRVPKTQVAKVVKKIYRIVSVFGSIAEYKNRYIMVEMKIASVRLECENVREGAGEIYEDIVRIGKP